MACFDRKINEQDVGIFAQPVEYNPAAIMSDIKAPHVGGIAEAGSNAVSASC